MSQTTGLSIIIPFYNVGKYLQECIDGLLSTGDIDKTEIILVDDGSTDSSSGIAKMYSDRYGFIRVLRIDNSGPSESRNTGLRQAKGRYVFFCDSDDRVVSGLFGKIIRLAETEECDIILWDSEIIDEKGNVIIREDSGYFAHAGLDKTEMIYTGKKLIETSLRNSGDFVATIWLGVYRREFLLEKQLFFAEGLIHEDELWVPKALLSAETVRYIPEKIYQYRMRKGSIMNPESDDLSESVASLMQVYPSLYKFYDEVLEGDPLKELIEGNLTKRYLSLIYKFRFYKYGYGKQIDKKLLWRTSNRFKDKIRVLLLYLIAR